VSDNATNPPIALITGASRGIGEATARELARRGYALALAGRSANALEALAGELTRAGTRAVPIPADLRSTAELQRLSDIVLDHFGRVDALILNAGIGGAGPVARMPAGAAAATIETNLLAPIALTHALLPQMLERRRGAIVLVGSVAGRIGLPGSAIYSASKFGLRGFADGLRREVAASGIGVTLVAPGFIRTAMTERIRLPLPRPAIVARAIADAIVQPRREVFVPGYYRWLVWAAHLAPGLADLALRGRGR
jgi:short-subunit dehydrogenase